MATRFRPDGAAIPGARDRQNGLHIGDFEEQNIGGLEISRQSFDIAVMATIKKICVYCCSGPGSDPAFVEAARALGKILASNGIGLVLQYYY